MESMSRDNFALVMAAFMEKENLAYRRIAKALTCSESTILRLLVGYTLPSDEMLKQCAVLIELGFVRYSKLTHAERKQLSEKIGTVGGGVVGFGSVTAAVSLMGSVAGLSAAGISSGLAALGALVGGGMVAGITVAAALPIAGTGIGWGLIRAMKYFFSEKQLDANKLNPTWEILNPKHHAPKDAE